MMFVYRDYICRLYKIALITPLFTIPIVLSDGRVDAQLSVVTNGSVGGPLNVVSVGRVSGQLRVVRWEGRWTFRCCVR